MQICECHFAVPKFALPNYIQLNVLTYVPELNMIFENQNKPYVRYTEGLKWHYLY